MTAVERRLLRHLVTAVLLKLAVLVVLWWLCVRDARVPVSAPALDARLHQTPAHPSSPLPLDRNTQP